jgi:hypothetical protein
LAAPRIVEIARFIAHAGHCMSDRTGFIEHEELFIADGSRLLEHADSGRQLERLVRGLGAADLPLQVGSRPAKLRNRVPLRPGV